MMNQYHWQKTYGSTLPPQGTDVFCLRKWQSRCRLA